MLRFPVGEKKMNREYNQHIFKTLEKKMDYKVRKLKESRTLH